MTDRERFEEWIDLQQHDGYKDYDIWQAATLAERERCIEVLENTINENCGEEPSHEGIMLISLGVLVESRINDAS